MRLQHALTTIAALTLSTGVLVAQQDRATFILNDGERMSGTVVVDRGARTNIRGGGGDFSVRVPDGSEVPLTFEDVTVIDFVGGLPIEEELTALPVDGHLLSLRNGELRRGRLVDLVRGNTVLWENPRGTVVELPMYQVRRIYLNGDRAREMYGFDAAGPSDVTASRSARNARLRDRRPAAANSLDRLTEVGSIVVSSRQPWTDTNLTVRAGEYLVFDPVGEIAFSRNRDHVSTPEGHGGRAGREAGLPLETAMVGALIGKVGVNGRPFLIGAGTDDIRVPASGRLFLGVNDDGLDDNSGVYEVVIYR